MTHPSADPDLGVRPPAAAPDQDSAESTQTPLRGRSKAERADSGDPKSGGLLQHLERRQDDVLDQLDELDAKIRDLLGDLEGEKEETETDDPDDLLAEAG